MSNKTPDTLTLSNPRDGGVLPVANTGLTGTTPTGTTPIASMRSSGQPDMALRYGVNLDFEKCAWEEAINFKSGRHGTYGYLLSWSGCGGLNLTPDITVVSPYTTPGQTMPVSYDDDGVPFFKCVGVIETFKFEGEVDDPIRINAYVSGKTAANLHARFSGIQPNTDVEVSWYIIACEGAGEGWYEAAYVSGFQKAIANIDSAPTSKDATRSKDAGGHLLVNINHASAPFKGSSEEVDVRLYLFQFQIIPASGTVNLLNFQTSAGAKRVLKWGKPAST